MQEKYPGYASRNSFFEICPKRGGGTEKRQQREQRFFSFLIIIKIE